MAVSPSLTARQMAFAMFKAQGCNHTDAARRAGYRGNRATLAVVGCANAHNPRIAAWIEGHDLAEMAKAAERYERALARGDASMIPAAREILDAACQAPWRVKVSLAAKSKADNGVAAEISDAATTPMGR